jgi:hypothetical protein
MKEYKNILAGTDGEKIYLLDISKGGKVTYKTVKPMPYVDGVEIQNSFYPNIIDLGERKICFINKEVGNGVPHFSGELYTDSLIKAISEGDTDEIENYIQGNLGGGTDAFLFELYKACYDIMFGDR